MDPSPSLSGKYSSADLETAANFEGFTMIGCLIIGLCTMVLAAKYRHPLISRHCLIRWLTCIYVAAMMAGIAVKALAHTYLDVLPNTCDAMIELAGPKRGNFSYPCQRDLLIGWFNQAITAGHLNVGELLKIQWVSSMLQGVLPLSFGIAVEEFARWAENRPIRLGDEKDMRELEEQKSMWGVCPHCSHGFVVPC